MPDDSNTIASILLALIQGPIKKLLGAARESSQMAAFLPLKTSDAADANRLDLMQKDGSGRS